MLGPVEVVHLIEKPPVRLPLEAFQARPTGRGPRGWPRTLWRFYISALAWREVSVHSEELEEVAADRDSLASLVSMLSPWPLTDKLNQLLDIAVCFLIIPMLIQFFCSFKASEFYKSASLNECLIVIRQTLNNNFPQSTRLAKLWLQLWSEPRHLTTHELFRLFR